MVDVGHEARTDDKAQTGVEISSPRVRREDTRRRAQWVHRRQFDPARARDRVARTTRCRGEAPLPARAPWHARPDVRARHRAFTLAAGAVPHQVASGPTCRQARLDDGDHTGDHRRARWQTLGNTTPPAGHPGRQRHSSLMRAHHARYRPAIDARSRPVIDAPSGPAIPDAARQDRYWFRGDRRSSGPPTRRPARRRRGRRRGGCAVQRGRRTAGRV